MAKAKRVSNTASSKAKDRATIADDWRRKLERDRAAFQRIATSDAGKWFQTFAASDAGKRFLDNQRSFASYVARLPRIPPEMLEKFSWLTQAPLAERSPDWAPPPTKLKRSGGRPRSLSDKHATVAKKEARDFLRDNPTASRDDVVQHVVDWLKTEEKLQVSASTVRDRVVADLYRKHKTSLTKTRGV